MSPAQGQNVTSPTKHQVVQKGKGEDDGAPPPGGGFQKSKKGDDGGDASPPPPGGGGYQRAEALPIAFGDAVSATDLPSPKPAVSWGAATSLNNYPNPFNPETTISFHLLAGQQARLMVYNTLGQPVQLLVDGWLGEGRHEVRFSAHRLPSGSYFTRLTTERGVSTRQIILMK